MRTVILYLGAFTLIIADPLMAQHTPPPSDQQEFDPINGVYKNETYGYSVRIPKAATGYRLRAPAPNHGLGLDLSGRDGYLWTNGEYDALLLRTSGALADVKAAMLCKKYGLSVVGSKRSSLSGLEAREIVLGARERSGSVSYIRLIVAMRAQPDGVNIVYEIGVRQRIRDEVGDATFSSLVESFHLIGLPH